MTDELVVSAHLFIQRFTGNPPFVNALAIELLCFLQSPGPSSLAKDKAALLLTSMVDDAASRFRLSTYFTHLGHRPSYLYPYSSWLCSTNDKKRQRRSARTVVFRGEDSSPTPFHWY